MATNRKTELQQKIHELEQWLLHNPEHPNTVEVQTDLRQANEDLINLDDDE